MGDFKLTATCVSVILSSVAFGAGNTVLVEFNGGKPYDLGLTVARPDAQINIDRKSLAVSVAQVPCEQYQRAWVTCAADPDPAKDPFFTIRLTRYVTAPRKKWLGRSYSAMADSFVDVATARKEKVGEVDLNGQKVPLWRIEVPLKTGDIQDIIFTDSLGDYLKEKGRYLDLELMGRVHTKRTPCREERVNTDRNFTSAVTVYKVELEKPSVEMEMKPIEPGNIFHNDEKPETRVELRVKVPGVYSIVWRIRDVDGKLVKEEALPVTGSEIKTIALAHAGAGWYSVDWELCAGERTLLTHNSAFAVLGQDTRKSEMGETYGTWSPFSGHYRCDVTNPTEREKGLKLLYKAGFRRAFDVGRTVPYEERRKWKVGDVVAARFPSDWWGGKRDEGQMKEVIAQRLRENPNSKAAMIFHESYPNPGSHAAECFGGTPDPKKIPAVMEDRQKEARRTSKFLRENFPELKIMIGNSLTCSKFIAELITGGFPESGADYTGLEAVGSNTLPEHEHSASLQTAECMREVTRHFGYKWLPNQCFESNFRLDTILGEDRQAQWYVRDILLSHIWRFPDIYASGVISAGNHYTSTAWGDSDMCRRMPLCYPKKAYVALATATKMLDGVTDREILETGDKTAYAIRFACRDGRQVYVFWTSRGTADFALKTKGVFRMYDLYGRIIEPESLSFWNRIPWVRHDYAVVAGESAVYLVCGKPAVLSARVTRRDYPGLPVPEDFSVKASADDATQWEVIPGKLPGVQNDPGTTWPARVAGKGVVRSVNDEEKGASIELELNAPDLALRPLVFEYMFARLKHPVGITTPFASIGAWVRGNSGWGELYFVLRDRHGRRTVSSSIDMQGKLDHECRQTICYSGWNFVSFPVLQSSSIQELSSGVVSWNWAGGAPVEFPVTIEGLVYSARSRPLFLSETVGRPYRQAIRIKDIGVFDLNRPCASPDYVTYDEVTPIDIATPATGATDVDFDRPVKFAWQGERPPPYFVELKEIPSGRVLHSAKTDKSEFEFAGLKPATVYAWSVRHSISLAEGTFRTKGLR